MSFHASVSRSVLEARHPVPSPGRMPGIPSAELLDMRQLRHHTKNALQGLIAHIEQAMEIQETEAGRRLARELQHRILLSARISDALFGFTGAPVSLEARLRSLCENIVRLFGTPEQEIRTEITVCGTCPGNLHEAILRSVHEMVGNAVKHGMGTRAGGLIGVRLETSRHETILAVQDDGCGFGQLDEDGQGLEIVRELIAVHAGSLRLCREATTTTATLTFPRIRSGAMFR